MTKQKKETLKSKRENPLYNKSFQTEGNGKLLDYDDNETGIKYRYAQYNLRPLKDCPHSSKGCRKFCYGTKGNHVFKNVKESRQRSYEQSKRKDFAESMVYTIRTEKQTKRYIDAIMLIRLHETGDFRSLDYLKAWVKVWAELENDEGWQTTFYTRCFEYFLNLTEDEKATLRRLMKKGKIAMNLSLDDTMPKEQIIAMLKVKAELPLANIYNATEDVDKTEHDNVCDCENCAKCGTCNKATGTRTVVKIHSASKKDMEEYRKHINGAGM